MVLELWSLFGVVDCSKQLQMATINNRFYILQPVKLMVHLSKFGWIKKCLRHKYPQAKLIVIISAKFYLEQSFISILTRG